MGPPDAKGFQPFIRHDSNHEITAGFAKRVENGEPLMPGAVFVEASPEPGTFNVIGSYQPEGSGPPRVSSNEYREGWDRIFGGQQPVGQA